MEEISLPSIFQSIRRASKLDPGEAKRASLIIRRSQSWEVQTGLRVLSNTMKTAVKSVAYVCKPNRPYEVEIKEGLKLHPGDFLP